jgi:ABC-type multidrug transport system fused ATPase/permease subunit
MFLFHGSVRENLLWGAEGSGEADIDAALESAHATAFVENLPSGLDTIIGDRGVLISAGQRQRLALARALLRRPRFLILDEPTSALDLESEDQIARTIEELKGTTTIVLVSHRLNAVRCADFVYTLDSGSVRPLGPGQEVYERASDIVF